MIPSHVPSPDEPPPELTGIPLFDSEVRDGQEWLARVNALCSEFEARALCEGCDGAKAQCGDKLCDAISDLLEFLTGHFEAEEQHMKSIGFSLRRRALFERHVEDHADITQGLARIIAALKDDAVAASFRELHALLDYWWRQHIPHHDKSFVAALRGA